MKIPKNYRFEEQLTLDMERVADIENRSVTNLIETVMSKYCKDRLPPDGKAEKKKKGASGKPQSKK